MQQEKLSASQAIALFNIQGGAGVVTDWQRRHHEQGLAGLQPRGRPKKMTNSTLPKDAQPAEACSREELEDEVQYLRAEVADLKNWRPGFRPKSELRRKSASSARTEARPHVDQAVQSSGAVT